MSMVSGFKYVKDPLMWTNPSIRREFIRFLKKNKVHKEYLANLHNRKKELSVFLSKTSAPEFIERAFPLKKSKEGYWFWFDIVKKWNRYLNEKLLPDWWHGDCY